MKVSELFEAVLHSALYTKLSVNEAQSTLAAHCKESYKAISTGGVLFRGDLTVGSDFALIDTTSLKRTSRDTDNGYQLIMDNAKALASVPKRSGSLICTTSAKTAEGYGHAYALIPFDGIKIAVSDTADFIYQDVIDQLGKSAYLLSELAGVSTTLPDELKVSLETLSVAQLLCNVFEVNSVQKLKQHLAKKLVGFESDTDVNSSTLDEATVAGAIEVLIDKYNFSYEEKDALENLIQAKPKLRLRAFASSLVFNRSDLGLKIVLAGKQIVGSDVECWFSGSAVAISLKEFKSLLNKLEASGLQINQRYKSLM